LIFVASDIVQFTQKQSCWMIVSLLVIWNLLLHS